VQRDVVEGGDGSVVFGEVADADVAHALPSPLIARAPGNSRPNWPRLA
jgi:hypothetical protein